MKTSVILILAVAVLTACAAPTPIPLSATAAPLPSLTTVPASTTLTVMAAASLSAPFQEIGKLFTARHPNVRVEFSFAGSQQLAQQLANAAPADVFASASQKYLDAAVSAGRVEKDASRVFARNRLIVIYPKTNPAGLKGLKDLAKTGLKLDLAAKEVPVGQYSLDFLDKAAKDATFGASFKDDVLKNVVSYEDNVKSVLAKVALGEADAGIVYTSDATGEQAARIEKIDIPDALNVIAVYPIAALKDSKQPSLAVAFVDLVLSTEGQDILAAAGFIPIQPAK